MRDGSLDHSVHAQASSRVAMAALAVLAVMILVASGGMRDPMSLQFQVFGLALGVLVALTWIVDRRDTRISSWLLVTVVAGAVLAMYHWLGLSGALTLLLIPSALAAVLISVPASTAVGAAETALLLLLAVWHTDQAGRTEVGIAVAGIWAIIGIMGLAYEPLHQMREWLDEYSERSRQFLDEARDRKAEL